MTGHGYDAFNRKHQDAELCIRLPVGKLCSEGYNEFIIQEILKEILL